MTMDVLGARNDSIEQSAKIAEKIELYKERYQQSGTRSKEQYEKVKNTIDLRIRGDIPEGRAAQKQMLSLFSSIFQPHIAKNGYFLGDTFIFTFDPTHHDTSQAEPFLIELCNTCTGSFAGTLLAGLLVRGAIAVGEYIVTNDGRTMLGPAVTDAITWCERADWAGMIVTPTTGLLLDETDQKHDYVKYNVRLSQGRGQASLWCLPWPFSYCLSDAIKNSDSEAVFKQGRKRLVQHFRENQTIIPAGVESKFANTIGYFDCFAENPLYIKKLREGYEQWQYGIQQGFIKKDVGDSVDIQK